MRSLLLSVILAGGATAAHAHPGHLADLAGHDHWVAGAAIAIAILTGLYGALKGKSDTAKDTDPEDTQDEATA